MTIEFPNSKIVLLDFRNLTMNVKDNVAAVVAVVVVVVEDDGVDDGDDSLRSSVNQMQKLYNSKQTRQYSIIESIEEIDLKFCFSPINGNNCFPKKIDQSEIERQRKAVTSEWNQKKNKKKEKKFELENKITYVQLDGSC